MPRPAGLHTISTHLHTFSTRSPSLFHSSEFRSKSLLENLPTVGGTDLDLPGQDAACR